MRSPFYLHIQSSYNRVPKLPVSRKLRQGLGCHTQVLDPCEVPDQHIAGSDAQDAAVPKTIRSRAVIGPLIVYDRCALGPIGAPHG